MRWRATVCDFDGVLVESEGVKDTIFREIFGAYPQHRDTMMEFHATHRSLPRRSKFVELARRLGRDGDAVLVESLADAFAARATERIAACPAVPGALEFLRDSASHGPVFVASMTPERELREILARRGIDRYVTRVYGDPPTSKARALEEIIRENGGDPDAIVFVGDSPDDLAAASQAGVRFFARDSGIPFPEPHPPLHPDLHAVRSAIWGGAA